MTTKTKRSTEPNAEPPKRSAFSKDAPEGHDAHGTPFKRVPGPGPKDIEKGAAGAQAIDRVEGGLERASDQGEPENAREDEDDSADEG